jgi:hypothetical protein
VHTMLCTFFKTVNMEQINFHSHEQQDEFIYNLFDQKSNGTSEIILRLSRMQGKSRNTCLAW